MIARLDEQLHRPEQRFAGAGEAERVGRLDAAVAGGDGLAEFVEAPCRGVAEVPVVEGRTIVVGPHRQQVGDGHRFGVGRGEVVFGGELPPTEIGLQPEVGQRQGARGHGRTVPLPSAR